MTATFRTSQIVSALDPSKPHIILVGLPGAGKSTVGTILAQKLGRTYLDFDIEIERREGMPIAQIFGELGEGGFRELELKLTEELKDLGNMVLAPGGGWITQPQVVALIRPPAATRLSGSVSDDGRPVGAALTSSWSVQSGPAPVAFDSPTAATTGAVLSAPGTYIVRLTASDTAASTSDDVVVMVAAANATPVLTAGPDKTVSLNGSAPLDGTVADDGLPAGASLATTWAVVSGPGTVSFADPHAAATTASFSAVGLYVLRLTASMVTIPPNDQPMTPIRLVSAKRTVRKYSTAASTSSVSACNRVISLY